MTIAQKKEPVIQKSYGKKYNLSTFFLLPIVSKNGYKINNYVNTFLYYSNDTINNENDYLYVLLKEDTTDVFYYKDRFVDKFTVKDGILYKFNISDFNKDLNTFIKGKYSELSEKIREIIFNSLGYPPMTSDVYKIINKTKERKKHIEDMIGQLLPESAELCSIINEIDEIY